jgi:hypothetical protein
MPRRPSRRSVLVAFAIAVIVAAMFIARASAWPAENALVGQSEAAIRTRYGQPKHEFDGHYGAPPVEWTRQFDGDVKSGVFRRLGGDLYVTFEKRNGQWIVISNSYLPRGGVF